MNKGLLIGIGAGVSVLSGFVVGKLLVNRKRKKEWLDSLEKDTEASVNKLVDYIMNSFKDDEKIRKLKLLYNEINEEKEISKEAKDVALIIVANKIREAGGCGTCGEKKEEPVKEEPVKEEPVKEEPKCAILPEYLKQVSENMRHIRELIILKKPCWDELIWVPLKYNESLVNDFLEASLGMDESKTEEGKAIINDMADIRRELQDIRAKIPIPVEVVVEPVKEESTEEEPAKEEPKDEVSEAVIGLTNVLAELEKHTDVKEKIASLEDYITQLDAMRSTLSPLNYVDTIAVHIKDITLLRMKANGLVESLQAGRFEKVVSHVKDAKEAVAQGKPFDEVAPDLTKKIIDEYLPLTEDVDKEEMEKVKAAQKEFLDENKPAYEAYKEKVNPVTNHREPSISNKRKYNGKKKKR